MGGRRGGANSGFTFSKIGFSGVSDLSFRSFRFAVLSWAFFFGFFSGVIDG